ncbi:hypothetical protein UMZ34_15370 [Halopseudomonas pachastrellae]|nr:hypothetical protein UMZ34_15370 [Halopseudomonas pachastrellae]
MAVSDDIDLLSPTVDSHSLKGLVPETLRHRHLASPAGPNSRTASWRHLAEPGSSRAAVAVLHSADDTQTRR